MCTMYVFNCLALNHKCIHATEHFNDTIIIIKNKYSFHSGRYTVTIKVDIADINYRDNAFRSSIAYFASGRAYPQNLFIQYWSFLNCQWQNLRLHCGCVAVPVNWFFDINLSFFAKFKNVVHSFEPGETPSNSASHQAPNYVQRS